MTHVLEVENIEIGYGGKPVVADTSFGLEKGRISCLLGPSGCGKTSLLRAIAGLESVSGGNISIQDKIVSRNGYTQAPEKRSIGMVFQDLALFPHLTVIDNIRFGIRSQPKREQLNRASELLEQVGLDAWAKQYPHQLSGGQQQRVALARALAPRPQMLLMDEPFSSMDAELREKLAIEIRDILNQEEVTTLLVTHDQFEAFAMADEIGVMNAGHIVQWDTAYNLYHKPISRFVADFIGLGTLVPGKILDGNRVETELGILNGDTHNLHTGQSVEILVRPDDIVHNDESPIMARIDQKHFRGAEFLYRLSLPRGASVLCFTPSHHNHKLGERIGIEIDIEHLVMFQPGHEHA